MQMTVASVQTGTLIWIAQCGHAITVEGSDVCDFACGIGGKPILETINEPPEDSNRHSRGCDEVELTTRANDDRHASRMWLVSAVRTTVDAPNRRLETFLARDNLVRVVLVPAACEAFGKTFDVVGRRAWIVFGLGCLVGRRDGACDEWWAGETGGRFGVDIADDVINVDAGSTNLVAVGCIVGHEYGVAKGDRI